MSRSTKDLLFGVTIVGIASVFLYFFLGKVSHSVDVRSCHESVYAEEIDKWTEQQKTETVHFCECVVDHPVNQISDEDLTPRESRILRQTAYDTCFGKVMVF